MTSATRKRLPPLWTKRRYPPTSQIEVDIGLIAFSALTVGDLGLVPRLEGLPLSYHTS
eukprot:SAG11_NODE_248_length_11654_cov_27.840329_6_plen_58_part_00